MSGGIVEPRITQESGTDLQNAALMLKDMPGALDKAVRSAHRRAASSLRTRSSAKIREVYAIRKRDLEADVSVRAKTKSSAGGIRTDTEFASPRIGLFKFLGTQPQEDVRQEKTVYVLLDGKMTAVHPSIAPRAREKKSMRPVRFDQHRNAFVAVMKNGHAGIFERPGNKDIKPGDRRFIREIMGDSMPQMLGDLHVAEELQKYTADVFDKRVEHEAVRLLNGWGK